MSSLYDINPETCPRCKKDFDIPEYGEGTCPNCGLKYFAERFFSEEISDYDVEITWNKVTQNLKNFPTLSKVLADWDAMRPDGSAPPTKPSRSRSFKLFDEDWEHNGDKGSYEYIAQFENLDKTFDIYVLTYQKGKSHAEHELVKQNSPTPYTTPSGKEAEVIHDYEFEDRIGPLELIRLIFELADPTGETDLESDMPEGKGTATLSKYPTLAKLTRVKADWEDKALESYLMEVAQKNINTLLYDADAEIHSLEFWKSKYTWGDGTPYNQSDAYEAKEKLSKLKVLQTISENHHEIEAKIVKFYEDLIKELKAKGTTASKTMANNFGPDTYYNFNFPQFNPNFNGYDIDWYPKAVEDRLKVDFKQVLVEEIDELLEDMSRENSYIRGHISKYERDPDDKAIADRARSALTKLEKVMEQIKQLKENFLKG